MRRTATGRFPCPAGMTITVGAADAIPFDQMPHLVNPPMASCATANSRPLPEGEGPFLGVDFIDGYRLAAIDKALQARSDWDVAATMCLQMDQRSVPWQEMRDHPDT